MDRIRRLISAILIIFLIIGRTWPGVVLAEETEPQETEVVEEQVVDPTPTPTPEVELTNEADVANNVDSEADTGDNEIVEPTPTPSPIPTESLEAETEETTPCLPEELEEGELCPEPTPTIEPDLEGGQDATEEASLNNTEETEDPSSIETGDAPGVVNSFNRRRAATSMNWGCLLYRP